MVNFPTYIIQGEKANVYLVIWENNVYVTYCVIK